MVRTRGGRCGVSLWAVWPGIGVAVLLAAGCGGGGGGGGGSAAPLTVVSQSPATGAAEVAVSSAVTLAFTSELDPATVDASKVALRFDPGWGEETVPVDVLVNGNVLTVKPKYPLEYNVTYTARVGVGAAADVHGQALDHDVEWTFSTETRNLLATGGGPIDESVILLSAPDIYLREAGAPPVGGYEYDGAPPTSAGDFVVDVGETKIMDGADLNGGNYSNFYVKGTLVITGTSNVEIIASSTLFVPGRIVVDTSSPILLTFRGAGDVNIPGTIDLSARTDSSDASRLEFLGINSSNITRFRLDGVIDLSSYNGKGGEVLISGVRADAIVAGTIDVRSYHGASGRIRVFNDPNSRVIIRGGGIANDGRSGDSPTDGGWVEIIADNLIDVGEGTTISANGGVSTTAAGGAGGRVDLNGSEQNGFGTDLNELVVAGVVTANGGAGTTRGAGGEVHLDENDYDPSFTVEAVDNTNWVEAVLSGRIEALGPGGKVRFHAMAASGGYSFRITDTATVQAPEGTLVRQENATTVTIENGATVTDGDGDADNDGSPVDLIP